MRTTPEIIIRAIQAEDDIESLTDLIHAAYAPHAANGLRYWGTHQTVADTRRRLASGLGFVATSAQSIVGTITLRGPQSDSPVALYRATGIWTFVQFAVAPQFKGCGVGKALHDHAVACAIARGAEAMVLDTAATSSKLIEMYRLWGYEICGQCDWRPRTNYLSVLMVRQLASPPRNQ
jgi:predicted N-acetyltransferase YhbS